MRPSRWQLAGVIAGAFAPTPGCANVRPGALRVLFWVQLLVGEFRANESGTAVCCLSTGSLASRLKAIALFAGVAVAIVALMVSPYTAWALLAVLTVAVAVYWALIWRTLKGIGANRRLRRARARDAVFVHTVASGVPGAGRALLEQLNIEADRRDWTLALEAGNEKLADYYARIGYRATGAPIVMPTDERNVPMCRRPWKEDP